MVIHRFAAPLLGIAAATALAAAPASAETAYNAKALKTSVSLADFKAIVGSLPGHSVEAEHIFSGDASDDDAQKGSSDDISLRGVDEDGLRYLLIGARCDDAICEGVQLQVRYDSKKIDYQKLNEANMYSASASVWFDQDAETLGVSQFVSAEHGVTMANLRASLVTLLGEAGGLASIALGKD